MTNWHLRPLPFEDQLALPVTDLSISDLKNPSWRGGLAMSMFELQYICTRVLSLVCTTGIRIVFYVRIRLSPDSFLQPTDPMKHGMNGPSTDVVRPPKINHVSSLTK